jgi:hypothetical protein
MISSERRKSRIRTRQGEAFPLLPFGLFAGACDDLGLVIRSFRAFADLLRGDGQRQHTTDIFLVVYPVGMGHQTRSNPSLSSTHLPVSAQPTIYEALH